MWRMQVLCSSSPELGSFTDEVDEAVPLTEGMRESNLPSGHVAERSGFRGDNRETETVKGGRDYLTDQKSDNGNTVQAVNTGSVVPASHGACRSNFSGW